MKKHGEDRTVERRRIIVPFEKLGGVPGVPFSLYDGATEVQGHTKPGTLYNPNALELTFACMGLSAMGASELLQN